MKNRDRLINQKRDLTTTHYNTLTNEFGDKLEERNYGYWSAMIKLTGEYEVFKSERSAIIFTNKISGKAKNWIKSFE